MTDPDGLKFQQVCFLFMPSSFLHLYPFLKFFPCYLHIKTSGIGLPAPAIGSGNCAAENTFLNSKILTNTSYLVQKSCVLKPGSSKQIHSLKNNNNNKQISKPEHLVKRIFFNMKPTTHRLKTDSS